MMHQRFRFLLNILPNCVEYIAFCNHSLQIYPKPQTVKFQQIQLEMLGTEMHEVVKGLKKVQLEYDASQMDGPVSETFLMVRTQYNLDFGLYYGSIHMELSWYVLVDIQPGIWDN